MSGTPLTDEQLMEIAQHGTLAGVDLAKRGADHAAVTVSGRRVAELKLLAARAEASIDESLGVVRYAGMRRVAFVREDDGGPTLETWTHVRAPFNMFALSVAERDVMFCRSPEIAKFIVALLDFGGAVVAECGASSTPA